MLWTKKAENQASLSPPAHGKRIFRGGPHGGGVDTSATPLVRLATARTRSFIAAEELLTGGVGASG